MVGEIAIILLAVSTAPATAPGPADSAFPVALAWVNAIKRNDVGGVLEATSLPFVHRSTGLKAKCERSTETPEDLTRWVECVQHSNDLLLSELAAGDDVRIEPYRGPPMKAFKKLEKGLPDGQWTMGYLNGDGVTFTLRFLVVKGSDGISRVAAFLVKAFFEGG
jgi:hypothetical protein